MAPMGHLHFHPRAPHYHDDFAAASPPKQAHFIHEMTHVWQAQRAEIVRHAFLLRSGATIPGVADKAAYDDLVAFPGVAA